MRKIALLLASSIASFNTAQASQQPTSFLGPNFKMGFSSPLTDSTAYSVGAETGVKNFRLSGTLGWRLTETQRFKMTGEYLWQKIHYSFFEENSNQWVRQGSISGNYRYDFLDYAYHPAFDFSSYLSHAPNKSLATHIIILSPTQTVIDQRRIAGSNAWGFSPGISIQPWFGGKAGVDLNYDHVRYKTNFISHQNAKGFGGTVHFSQILLRDFEVGTAIAIRKPYNNYAANIAWTNLPYFSNWTIGIDGGYTVGKRDLPNTYDVSLSANYSFERLLSEPVMMKDVPVMTKVSPVLQDDLINWTSKPVFNLPQVLAIPDEAISFSNIV